jgi:hypothetical protein
MRKIGNIFFENIGLKILALVLAVILWLLAKGHIVPVHPL